MSTRKPRKRLDEILVQQGLVSQEQINDALSRQKQQGGKFGSHLLYHRYVDEIGLVKALAIQFQCEAVVLSKVEIRPEVAKMIPGRVAYSRKAMPFDYDPNSNTLKVACEDPTDQGLINELNFVAHGKQIQLYVAAELSINTALAKHYPKSAGGLSDDLLVEIPEEGIAGDTDAGEETNQVESEARFQREILLVTEDETSTPSLTTLFEQDNYRVTLTDSADEAIHLINDHNFSCVLIKESVAGDYLDLIDRLRKTSPRTVVRFYESVSSLLIDDETTSAKSDLLDSSLELLTSLLAHQVNQPDNHGLRVGNYVKRLCRRLGLPLKERMMIVTAAYVHDLSRYYYHEGDTDDSGADVKVQLQRTVHLLTSLNFPPIVIEMLRSMYIDLKGKYRRRLPIEVLGGNILTTVDIFCDNVPADVRLSLDRFDAIRKKLRDLVGKLFLTEVVEAFIAMMQEEILATSVATRQGQVMLVSDDIDTLHPIELRLKNEGFHMLASTSAVECAELCERSRPDILLMITNGGAREVRHFISSLQECEVDIANIPTFLVVRGDIISSLTSALDSGIEDIVNLDASTELLIAKLDRILTRRQQAEDRADELTNESGTTGRLSDMSLIDILQAMGPSRKTAMITITPAGEGHLQLELYLKQGDIHYASLGDKGSPEAVYEALAWTDGQWRIQPIDQDELPEANNHLPNDAILMEGCRLIDEQARSGKLGVS